MPSTSATDAPIRCTAWDISTPTGPPPRTTILSGTSVSAVTSRFVHTPSASASPGIGGITASDPVRSRRSRCRAPPRRPPPAGTGEPRGAAKHVDPWSSSQPTRRVRVVRDHEVAPPRTRPAGRARSPPRARRGPRAASRASPRPQQGLRRDAGVVAALAADQVSLHDRADSPPSASCPAQCSPPGRRR